MSGDPLRSVRARDGASRATDDERPRATDESPPFGRSWAVLYAAVLLNLALLVLLFYLFTRAFR
ncbi:MAG TPA: hypothetical protein VF064_20215 [Pyrinomonadaceae bacterium]